MELGEGQSGHLGIKGLQSSMLQGLFTVTWDRRRRGETLLVPPGKLKVPETRCKIRKRDKRMLTDLLNMDSE